MQEDAREVKMNDTEDILQIDPQFRSSEISIEWQFGEERPNYKG